MDINAWLHLFISQIVKTSLLEWIAVACGVASVLLARVNNVWLYPTGIVSTCLYIYLFFRPEVSLFAEGLLNAYYLIMSIYGWIHWLRRKNEPSLPVTRSGKKDWSIVFIIVAVLWTVFFLLLENFTPSNVPVWDAWVSATACAGMWLLAQRKIENWILLNISNAFAIPLQLYKQMPLTAILTLFLFIVAIFGYFEWKKIYKKQHAV